MSSLTNYRRNVYSQNGEDGVLGEIFRRLGITTGWFVEFGAWDGKHLSNTYQLLVESGWSGVYIEGDAARHADLVRNMAPYADRVATIQAFVRPTGTDSLDALLATTRLPIEFDFLSIDIDSDDWFIWQGLSRYSPRIVCIEINNDIPPGIWQTNRDGIAYGSSFTATVDLGKRKGYTPVCHTGNVIFVRNDLVDKLEMPREELEFAELLFDQGWLRFRFDNPYPFPVGYAVRTGNWVKRLIGWRRPY
jgi:hypothetical protein